jgi:formylglycine-generating enzyme required for sulfatase activity
MNARVAVMSSLVAAFSLLTITGSRSDEPVKAEKAATDSILRKTAGQVRDDNGLKMKLVWCPAGFVTMEQVEVVEEPVTPEDEAAPKTSRVEEITPVKVLLSNGYWLGKYEVTQSEWKQVMETEPWKGKTNAKQGADYAASYISWEDATEFCRKLTDQEREAGRLSNDWAYTLPTEAEWERACRARTETKFSFGDDASKLGEYAWYSTNASFRGDNHAHQVGQKNPNPWGLFDMHGNVHEWCRDVYTKKLPGGRDPDVKANGKTTASNRVLRGGGHSVLASYCRSASRDSYSPTAGSASTGIRVALSAAQ